jgi:hypothetical protein
MERAVSAAAACGSASSWLPTDPGRTRAIRAGATSLTATISDHRPSVSVSMLLTAGSIRAISLMSATA